MFADAVIDVCAVLVRKRDRERKRKKRKDPTPNRFMNNSAVKTVNEVGNFCTVFRFFGNDYEKKPKRSSNV